MASVILKSVGAAVGNMLLPGIGGAVLGGLGGSFGGMVDGQLGLGTHVTGPRLDNLAVQDSRYGAGIPIVYGNARVAGNVIWSTDLIQTQHDNNIGKGGGSGTTTTTYTYSVHCAVGICAGAVGGINTIWADSTIIYQGGVWSSGICDSATIYTGAAGQAPDPFMQSILGSVSVPAYANLAYIVFDNLQLASFGNRLPNLTFELAASTSTNNPLLLTNIDVGMSQRFLGTSSGTMTPITLQGSSVTAQSVLIGGYSASGSSISFTVASYDVTGSVPVQQARVNSASFTAAAPVDCSWALSPDGRFVALYLQNGVSVTHNFVIYDTQTQSFGAVYATNLTAGSSSIKQIAWIDAQHFVIDDSSGTVRGLHVFARAGTGIVDLGFTPLWGSGSLTGTTLFYGAQFTPYAGGLLAYVWTTPGTGTLTLQARSLSWRNNALSVGTAYIVVSGLALGSGSGPNARFLQSGGGEYTLFYGTVVDYRLLSFDPGASAATVTRLWQIITPVYGTSTTQFPVFYGDRILVLQRAAVENNYRLSEVMLGSGGFTVSVNAVAVGGTNALATVFQAIRLDGGRLLVLGVGGFAYDLLQCAVLQRNANGSVAAIMSDILTRAGYASGDYDMSALNGITIQGYVLQDPMSARSAIEPLQAFTPFDVIESAGQLKAVPRGGGAALTIASNEWRAASAGKIQPPPLLTMRAQEMDLPREIDVDFIDPARNFELNSQRARRIATHALSAQKINLPVVCDAGTAKQIAEARLYTMWAERDLVKLSVSRAWAALDPADVIDLGTGNLLRVTAVTQSGGLIQVEGFYASAATLSSAAQADGGQSIAADGVTIPSSVLYLMDLPLLRADDDQPGVYIAATGLSGWKGASLMRSSDGANYSVVGSLALAATAGIATTALAPGSPYYIDNASSVTVQLTQGALSSCSFIDMSNGANAALLGGEIVQFQTATLVGPGLYMLSHLLRGRRGTESALATHAVGENFILLQDGAVDFLPGKISDRGRSYDFRALTMGQSLGDAQDYVFTYGMKSLCPLSPATIRAVRSLGVTGDLTLSWARRARLNAEWVDYIDVPLDETQELYEVDIMNGSAVVRAFTGLTAPTVTYTTAQQTADWGGSIPATFTVNIYQISTRYGNGTAAMAIV